MRIGIPISLEQYAIQGANAGGANCASTWDTMIKRFQDLGYKGEMKKVKYYATDYNNCDEFLATGDLNTSNKELGRLLAWKIYMEHTRYGRPVNLVSHSMGGLILAAALTGTRKKDTGTSIEKGWPPYLYVANVVTISPPFDGGRFWPGVGCFALAGLKVQCVETTGGSEFLKWLIPNAQGSHGTDWTLIGTNDDDIVDSDSALSWEDKGVGHAVRYVAGQPLEHDQQTTDRGTHPTWYTNYWYWNYYDSKTFYQENGASIIDTAYKAIYYSWRW